MIDLVASNSEDTIVDVLLADGRGGFTRAPRLETAWGPWAAAAADFDVDGHTDLAVLYNVGEQVQFFLGDSRGNFRPERSIAVGSLPSGIAAGDFDEDGVDDLAVSNQLGNSVGLILSDP
jgi:hypothetical protein